MPKVSVSSEVAAAPDKVWQLVIDLPRYAEWMAPHDSFLGEVPATLDVGVSYKQRVKMMGMPADIAWRVSVADAPGRLEVLGDGPMGVKAQNRFVIEPAGDGTKVTFEMEFNGPALVGPMAGMVEKQSGVSAKESLGKFTALLA